MKHRDGPVMKTNVTSDGLVTIYCDTLGRKTTLPDARDDQNLPSSTSSLITREIGLNLQQTNARIKQNGLSLLERFRPQTFGMI